MATPNQLWLTLVVLNLDVITFVVPPTNTMYLGRDSSTNDIVLHDKKVSRIHARLTARGHQFILQDLESAGGTRINGKRISQEIVLANNDAIRIGPYLLRAEIRPWRRLGENEAGSQTIAADPDAT